VANYFTVLFSKKRWLLYGSCLGGVIGALLMHLNESFHVHGALSFGIPMGMGLAVALGMVGGLVGGVLGAFIASRSAHEDLVMGLGESMGVGLMNGFLTGTATGAVMGAVHTWWPHHAVFSNLVLLSASLVVALLLMRRKIRE
jgi:hypothetical protein